MKNMIRLLSTVLLLSSIIIVNFVALGSTTNKTPEQCVHVRLSGKDLNDAVKMALLDANVLKLSKFLQTLNYKPRASDDMAVRVAWSDGSGQFSVTGVGLVFKDNEDNATIVCVQKEEESRALAFTYRKSDNGTVVAAYRVDQNGNVVVISGIFDCIACAACVLVEIVVVVGCISSCCIAPPWIQCVPLVIACVAAATGVELSVGCVEACIACYKSVGGAMVPVDKFSLLAPYAICSVFVTISTISVAVYRKKREDQNAEPESKTRKCSSVDSQTH